MSEGLGRIGLKETIAALRKELIDSIISAQDEKLCFEVGEMKLEFQIEVENSTTEKGVIKFWVVELGADGALKDKTTHKVTIPLKPVRIDGQPVLTSSPKKRV